MLAFGQPGTWSIKYNLLWDRALGLGLFPPELVRRELAYYRTKFDHFGLPLDNRERYTKLDWLIWIASLADDREEFEAFVEPVFRWANETTDRHPLSDWFRTDTGDLADPQLPGFFARSVVAGVYAPLYLNAFSRSVGGNDGRGPVTDSAESVTVPSGPIRTDVG